ncbi:hypothetical protein SapgrDRAFT_1483 [Saprospira grandis DSM 2844]|uniref:Uncharacterized protein n=1 Tax=Saprospira grandis DSM 2844 TaxID=694433 RepID=J0P0A4_9BACT|nr:hypothetical protein SapgrDRAFT_1483 [Saprospira grandis DSM 2844]
MSSWSGRAVSQLAVRSALRRLCRLGLALRATAVHPSACGGFAACKTAKMVFVAALLMPSY